LSACAGKLEDPERFAAVLERFDGGTAHSGLLRDAGAGSGAQDAGSDDELPACVSKLFKDTCGASGCHEKNSMTLDLVSPGVTERLVDQKSESMLCKGRKYISTAGASLMFEKLGDQPPCGAKMPLVGTLSAEQKTCLVDWIDVLDGPNQ
jgi:hypothetical protein